jgi:hypothetical protein
MYKLHYPSTVPSLLEILPWFKKIDSALGPLRRMKFAFEYLGEFEAQSETALGYETWALA